MIRVYGKPGCATCEALKKKLDILGRKYDFIDVSERDGWRENGLLDFSVELEMRRGDGKPELPLAVVSGVWCNYPEAIAKIRGAP